MLDQADIESPPASWANWIEVVEVPYGAVFCSELFRKTFGQTVPNWGAILSRFTKTHPVVLRRCPISTFGNEIEQATSEVDAQMAKWCAV